MSDAHAAVPAVGSGTPLRFLPRSIRVPQHPLRAIAVGWLTAFPISIALGMLTALLIPQAAPPQFNVEGAAAIVALVLFAPVVETIIMGVVLLVLTLFLSPAVAVIVSALGWGVAHSMITPTWGLVIWWPFLIFSTLFVAWRSRSLFLAFAIPAVVHALQNVFPAILVALGLTG